MSSYEDRWLHSTTYRFFRAGRQAENRPCTCSRLDLNFQENMGYEEEKLAEKAKALRIST